MFGSNCLNKNYLSHTMTHLSKPSSCRLAICFLLESYYPVVGGMETQARMLAQSLVANGFRVFIITRRVASSMNNVEHSAKISIFRIPPVGDGHFQRWKMIITCLPILMKIRKRFDILFVPGFRALGMPAVVICKLFHKMCILKSDSNGEMSGAFFASGLEKLHLTPSLFLFKIFASIRNKLLRYADSFVAISSEIATELKNYGVSDSALHLIPNSVDTKVFRPVSNHEKHKLRQKLALPISDIIVTFTGRLVSYKGLPLLIRVWKKIHEEHQSVSLLIVGSGGSDIHKCEAQLKDYVQFNNLGKSVYFTGDVHNVHEYLQASDIFVFPTENEAFGISLIEAMACGLPIISTHIGGLKDVVIHEQNGLVVEAGNFGQLHGAINTLITDASLSASLRKAALKAVQHQYTRDIVTKEYIKLFKRLSK